MAEFKIPVRYYRVHEKSGEEFVEANFRHGERFLTMDLKETALVLVDIWNHGWGPEPLVPLKGMYYEYEAGKSFCDRSKDITLNGILPLLKTAREFGMTIIHAPAPPIARRYSQWVRYAGDEDLNPTPPPARDWPPPDFAKKWRSELSESYWSKELLDFWTSEEVWRAMDIPDPVKPRPEEFVISTVGQMDRLLRHLKILYLFYAGFTADKCVQFRPYGLRAMAERGYCTILLRDCTTAIEGHDTVADLWMTKASIRMIEMNIGYSATSKDLIKALQSTT